jgi:hypothetical protein
MKEPVSTGLGGKLWTGMSLSSPSMKLYQVDAAVTLLLPVFQFSS